MQHLHRLLSKLDGVTKQGRGWRACCPVHMEERPSLSISLGEGNRILLNCHACGAGRQYCLKFLQATGLTWKDLAASAADRTSTLVQQAEAPRPLTEADADFRNEVYTFLAERTGLTPTHKRELLDRGLSEEHVFYDQYFSLEDVQQAWGLDRLLYLHQDRLFEVPGFKSDVAGRPRFAGRAGLFIPVRDEKRRIVAGQIRKGGTPKYQWLKGSGSPYHVPLCVGTPPAEGGGVRHVELWITEGPLKADVAALLGGLPLVAVAGVTAWRSILPALRRWETKRVVLAFDADSASNPAVAQQEKQLAEALQRMQIEVSKAEWPVELGKGIDDLIAAGHKPEVREWEKCRQTC